MNTTKKLRVAAIGDIHVHEHFKEPYRMLFEEISAKTDVLALCGDMTMLGLVKEAEILAKDLIACQIPVVAVLGNHDYHSGEGAQIKEILSRANVHFLEEEPFELNGVGFAGTKGFAGGFENHMLSAFGEEMIKAFVSEAINESLKLENSLKNLDTEKKVVVLHYSPISETIAGEPVEIYPFLGCSRLAETINRFHVSAVVHGHAHYGSYAGKTSNGTPVYNCAKDVLARNNMAYALLDI